MKKAIAELKRLRSILSGITGFEDDDQEYIEDARKSVDQIIEALEKQPAQQQERMAWVYDTGKGYKIVGYNSAAIAHLDHGTLLVPNAPQPAQQPAPSQYGSPELQAMIVARAIEKDKSEQPAQQEPVAHIPLKALEQIKPPMLILNNVPIYGYGAEGTVAVYTTPPQRTWVGLRDDEIYSVLENLQIMHHRPPTTDSRVIFAQAIEAKLKEKNT